MTNPTIVGRGRARARRTLLALTTALCTGLAAPAMAGTPHPNLDANGVDLTDGSFNLQLPIASIGSGQAELPIVAYDGQLDNWSNIDLYQTVVSGVTKYSVTLGHSYDNFTSTGPGSIYGTGATLTASGSDLVYRALDGKEITFSNPAGYTGGSSNLCDAANTNNCHLLPSAMSGKSGLDVTFAYDMLSDCTSVPIESEIGPDCVYTWRLASVSNSAGYSINWSFAGTGMPDWQRRVSAALKNGTTTISTVAYANPSADIYTITTPGGKSWRINGGGLFIYSLRRPGASSDTTTVSRSGGTTTVTRDGVTTVYNRSVSGSTATMTVTDAQSHVTTVISDLTKFRPTSVTDPLSRTTAMTYDSLTRPTEITYPEGNKVQYSYDSRGNLIETRLKAKPSVGGTDIVTSAGFASTCTDPSCNSPQWTRDANGNQTDYTYNTTTGLLAAIAAPAPSSGANRPETRLSYSTVSGVQVVTGVSACQTGTAASCVGTADEAKQTIGYDGNLNPTTVTVEAGNGSPSATVTRGYDAAGNLVSVDGPLSGSADTTTYRWSADREPVGTIAPDPDGAGSLQRRAVKTTYTADGQPSVVETGTVAGTSDTDWAAFSSEQQVTTTYDANARAVKSALTADGTTYSVTQTAYDAIGRVECAAQRMNPVVYGSLPSSACSLGTTGSYGADRIVKATYDAAGQVIKITSAYGTSDAADEATATYSNNGQVATATDAEGNKTSYGYDGFDRLATTTFPSTTKGAGTSNSSDYEQLSYDANGDLTSRRLRDGNTIYYGYDYLTRLKIKDLPGSEPDVTYAYDLLGHLTGASTSAQTLTFGWDALGRQVSETGPLGTMGYGYDAAGQFATLTWPDSNVTTYTWNPTGAPAGIYQGSGTSTALVTYSYDSLGRRTAVARGNGLSTSYGYDAVSRLASQGETFGSVSYSYNPAGQIASRTGSNTSLAWSGAANASTGYTANGLNQYTAMASASPGYDSKGNLTSLGSTSYGYNAENRLTSGPGTMLTYDPIGRLYQVATASTTTRFQYVGNQIAAEYDGSNNRLRRHVPGPGADEPVVTYENSGIASPRYLHADERGSIAALSNASGSVTAYNGYDEYGIPNAGNLGRFGYTGQAWLSELSLSYYKARMYAPGLGRFMQTDPIKYADGLNWYNYTKSDPVNHFDPTGLETLAQCIAKARIHYAATGEATSCGSRGGGGGAGGGGGGAVIGNDSNGDVGAGGEVPSYEGPEVVVTARKSCGLFCRVGKLFSRHPIMFGALAVGLQFIPGVDAVADAGIAAEGAELVVGEEVLAEDAVLQAGSRTIKPSTARALGIESRREAGRAVEKLKRFEGLGNDFHGAILRNGNYVNPQTGEIYGNIFDFLP